MKAWQFILMLLMTLHLNAQKIENGSIVLKDSIVTNISSRYESRSFLHTLIMGRNYRESWSTPVRLPVFHVNSSDFEIERLGGGQQTKSLHLLDEKGRHWLLRTVDKDVEAAIPKILRNKLGEKMVQDMISASFPYSHVITGQLAKAAGIHAPQPQIVFVADNEGLKQYRSIFANKVCTLEETEPDQNTIETEAAATKITTDNRNRLLQKQVLKARLLDMLIGDWDRHDGQWEWMRKDSAAYNFYYVIPKDRDNALFYAKGIIPTIVKNTFMTHIKGFKKNSSGLKQLSKKAHVFDAFFLNELDANEWKESILEFQQQISDSVIVSSIKKIPQNVYSQYGEQLIEKLKSRRNGLMKNGMKYYRYLAGEVDITGSNKEELFVVSGKKDQMTVTVYRGEKNPKNKIYERSFNRSETKSLVLNGLQGADHFLVEDSAPSDIKLHIFGNEGKDVYTLKGKTRSRVVDIELENNVVLNNDSSKIDFR